MKTYKEYITSLPLLHVNDKVYNEQYYQFFNEKINFCGTYCSYNFIDYQTENLPINKIIILFPIEDNLYGSFIIANQSSAFFTRTYKNFPLYQPCFYKDFNINKNLKENLQIDNITNQVEEIYNSCKNFFYSQKLLFELERN